MLPAIVLSGLGLGGYVAAAWPNTTATAKPEARVAEVVYPSSIFVYELRSTMLIDSIMAAQEPVDAH